MKNISFDNPYLLLVFIPLALAVIIPYIISVSKDNKTAGWGISLGIHLVISALVTLALAGIMSVTVLTKTTVYVVADVSYSSERNLDEIDETIARIKDSLPQNSELGIVCFGAKGNYIQLTPAGKSIKSVKEADIDKSGTDIVSALNYTESLFKEGTIKRIVLITDGNDTISEDASSIAAAVDRLTDNGVKIDAVFLNNTLKEGEHELQISGAEYRDSAYIGHESEAKFLINTSADMNVMLELYSRPASSSDGEWERLGYTVTAAQSGLSTITMSLPTDVSDSFEYKAVVSSETDLSPHNNEFIFTQTVEGKLNILLITGSSDDAGVIKSVYGESADIDSYVISGRNNNVPFTLEELVEYDEFIVSNVDIREINHINAFIDALDIAVSQYGKSLIALGDLKIQDEPEDRIFEKFEELLPVSYGNSSREGKLYTIVFDVSHSMFTASKYPLAKETAIRLLSLLNDEDYVCFITFSGKVTVRPAELVGDCKAELIEYIEGLTTGHGTDIAMGLEEALKAVGNLGLDQNQVMLISDGFSFASKKSAEDAARELFVSGTPVSAVNIFASSDGTEGRATLKRVVAAGEGGAYYEVTPASNNQNDVVFGEVSNEVTEAVINKVSTVNIARYKDAIAEGFIAFPSVSRYVQSLAKFDATVPLTVNYEKRQNYVVPVPLYAYRSHGNGTVAAFTASLSGTSCSLWDEGETELFVKNMLVSNTPIEKVDYPFTVKLEQDDFHAYLEITPSVLNASAEVNIRVTRPNGQSKKITLEFDSQKYTYMLDIVEVGTYKIDITYECESLYEKEFETTVAINVPYLKEYNAFTSFTKSTVYSFMHGNGQITEGDIPSLENDDSEISKTRIRYTIPLLIAAVSLFIADIIVRKLRFNKKHDKKKRNKEKTVRSRRARRAEGGAE